MLPKDVQAWALVGLRRPEKEKVPVLKSNY